jgi:glycosyltransferase involved in cell wall biosynthesis
MKSIILCCNYNEGRTGNLIRSLDTLKKNKLDNTIIGIIDNGSKDNSAQIINEFVKNGTVDCFIHNKKNLGKPKALNLLFKYIINVYELTRDDICIHIDSDIKIYDNFIKDCENCFNSFNDCYLYFSRGSSNEHEIIYDHTHAIDDSEYIDVDDNYLKVHRGPGIAGGLWGMKVSSFIDVNLYRENRGKNGKSAIYGGDDGFLIYDLFCKNANKFAYVHKTKYHFHPGNTDEEYQKWKVQQSLLTGKINQTAEDNVLLAEKGFYD